MSNRLDPAPSDPHEATLVLNIDPALLPTAQQDGERYVPGKNGRPGFIHHYVKTKVKKGKDLFGAAFINEWNRMALSEIFGDQPKNRPWYIRVTAYYALPKSYPESRYGTEKTTKPDYDNLTKGPQDVITRTQLVWKDDAQVQSDGTYRFYVNRGEEPRIEIRLRTR